MSSSRWGTTDPRLDDTALIARTRDDYREKTDVWLSQLTNEEPQIVWVQDCYADMADRMVIVMASDMTWTCGPATGILPLQPEGWCFI